VLLLRELMNAWRGNEMSFGVVMTVWLLTGGLGSAAYGLFARRFAPTRMALGRGLLVLGVLAPSSLLVSRALRGAMGLGSGEVAGFAPLVLASLLSLAPFTLLAGFMFALSTSVLHAESRSPLAAGRVYLTEALGASAAGLAVSFVMLPRLDPFSISLAASLATAVASLALLMSGGTTVRRAGRGSIAAALALALVAAAAIGPLGARLDDTSVGAQWRDVGFVGQRNSIYGRVVAAGTGSQKSLYESGVLAASAPDRMSAEERVHLAMLAHPRPSRVLMLGGGLGGGIAEVLKHPSVRVVDYVELDPELVRTARSLFGGEMTAGLDDPRVRVHFGDARFFVKHAETPYDVVIVGVPDPTTAQINRFYTVEFMGEVERALTADGVAGFTVQSAANYIGDELAAFLACIEATARTAFPAVALYPGDVCHIVVSRSDAYLSRDPAVLSERVLERGLDVAYVRDYYLADRLSAERVEHLDSALERATVFVNTDLRPSAYYLSMVLWNRQFSGAPGVALAAPRYLTTGNALVVSLALLAVLVALVLGAARSGQNRRPVVVAAIVLVGATEISLELAALLSFQSIYGYVYRELAIIVAAFMAGLGLGGWLGTRAARVGAGVRAFAALQLFIAGVPLVLAAVLAHVAALPPGSIGTWAAFFPLIVVGSAVLAGVQFPIAVKLVADDRADAGTVAGRLYGADLLGSAAGATVTAVFLLPVMGTVGTLHALALMNAAVCIALVAAAVVPGRRRR
jgi:spermidine synthase